MPDRYQVGPSLDIASQAAVGAMKVVDEPCASTARLALQDDASASCRRVAMREIFVSLRACSKRPHPEWHMRGLTAGSVVSVAPIPHVAVVRATLKCSRKAPWFRPARPIDA